MNEAAIVNEAVYRRLNAPCVAAYAIYTECVRLQPDKVPYLGNRAAAGWGRVSVRARKRSYSIDYIFAGSTT